MRDRFLIALLATGLASCTLNVEERTREFECPAASSCTFFVECESGESLTGGGFKLNDPGVGVLEIWASHPDIGDNRWRVTTMNKDTKTMTYSIYSLCSQVM